QAKLELKLPPRTATGVGRFPIIEWAGVSPAQRLAVPHPGPWLAAEARWVTPPEAATPMIELAPVGARTAPGSSLLADSGGPLLFDQAGITALTDLATPDDVSVLLAGTRG